MSGEPVALLALTRFEILRGVARQGAWMGFAIFLGATTIGAYDYWFRNGEPASLFGEGFIIWMMGLVSFGIAVDRRRAFDEYLIRNHISVRTYVAAKVLALVTLILGAGAIAFIVRLAATADVPTSLWSASVMTLIGLMIAPFAMMVESQVDSAMPAAFVVLGYAVAGGLALLVRRSPILFELTGFAQATHGSWTSVMPLALRTAIALIVGFAIAGALIRLRLRRY